MRWVHRRNDVSHLLIHNDTFPSWGFSTKHGATSIWERWNGWTPETGFGDPGMNSFGAVYQWMVENIGGIRNDGPAYKKIVITPTPGGKLTSADVRIPILIPILSLLAPRGSSWVMSAMHLKSFARRFSPLFSVTLLAATALWSGFLQLHAAEVTESKSALETNPQGWADILPPADLKGWYRVPVPPTGKLGRQQWHLDAGKRVLVCDGDGGHDMLLTEKEYGDAIFHFEFRYTKVEGKGGYNSGAYVRNSKDGAIWHQAQFGDATGGYLFGQTPAPDGKKKFFSLAKQVTDKRVKRVGEWNTMEITAQGKTLTLWVNGAVTCQFDECAAEKGRLGLEGEGYRIEFRNVKVKSLK